jgi:23S rRNA (cytosine1962-C5)-methyltransferase
MPTLTALTPTRFADYELLDSGAFLKMERFGEYITIRPEPQAVWDPGAEIAQWEREAHVRFVPKSSNTGDWRKFKSMPDQWHMGYTLTNGHEMKFRLGMTAFKHLGIFPEQASNWEYITESIGKLKTSTPKFLNLFAYTGGASMAARAAGADTTHLDSVKQVVSWANENMQQSGLKDIRWVVEDALKYVRRETKRGNKYHGIILDPPAYGHGPTGEKWKLEDHLNEMMKCVLNLLDPEEHFLILNAYSLGYSPLILDNLVRMGNKTSDTQLGELYLADRHNHHLPLGAYARFRNF